MPTDYDRVPALCWEIAGLRAVMADEGEDRRRQAEATALANAVSVYRGRRKNMERNEGIAAMLQAGSSWRQIQDGMGCRRATIAKVRQHLNEAAAERA